MWVDDTGDGSLSLSILDPSDPNDDNPTVIPVRCASKRLFLPTKKVLKDSNWDERVAFHPLSENLLRGESDVINTLVRLVRFRIGTTISILMSTLMDIAADPEKQADLTARQQKYLQLVGKVDKKAAKAVVQLVNNANERLISAFIHRGGGANDIKHRRVAQASFPIWDELHGQGSKIKSSNPSKYGDVECGSAKNKKAIAALFEYLIPDPDDKVEWSAGSDNDVAPYFDSLMRLYAGLSDHLNSYIHLFRKYLPHAKWLRVDLDWTDDLENLDKWKNKIPSLPGNIGALMKGETEEQAMQSAQSSAAGDRPNFLKQANSIGGGEPSNEGTVEDTPPWENPQPNQPAPAAPAYATNTQPEPQPESTGSGLSWNSVRSRQQQQQQPMYPNAQAYPGMQYQAQPAAQPGFMHPGQNQGMNQTSHSQFNPYANVGNTHQHPRFMSNESMRPAMSTGGVHYNTGGDL
tara:strand:- start:14728 stop:16116 length:1389 start_codon:yes stop_codon:yes gene_type:complete